VLAEVVEDYVWNRVEQILNDPALIMKEQARQQQEYTHRETEGVREIRLLQRAMGKLERELRQWERAYAAEVIGLEEFKGYKLDIQERRAMLEAQEQVTQESLQQLTQHEASLKSLTTYCGQVRSRLTVFDIPEKRDALEALSIEVRWTPGEAPQIKGVIPVEDTVSSAPLAHSRPPISAFTCGGSASRP
jgi:hypothetical protein